VINEMKDFEMGGTEREREREREREMFHITVLSVAKII